MLREERRRRALARQTPRLETLATVLITSQFCPVQQIRRPQLQGARQPEKRIERNHALAALDLADVGQAELRLEGQFLLRKFPRRALGTESQSKLSLELRSAVRHSSAA